MVRSFWATTFSLNWKGGLFLILLFGIPRFIIVLNAAVTRNYSLVSIIFLFMWAAPFILFTKKGRKFIGITRPGNYYWLVYSFLLGAVLCVLIYLPTWFFYSDTIGNSFVYIARSYPVTASALAGSDRHVYFLIYALIGMTFSPVGEELFYRGIVHSCFAGKFGERNSSSIDSLAFALTHLAHFGIVYVSGTWSFLLVPALLWVVIIFVAGKLFFLCKRRTGSLYGAILSHAGFNLAMMYFIFYHIS